jgi:WD40 repeat protein
MDRFIFGMLGMMFEISSEFSSLDAHLKFRRELKYSLKILRENFIFYRTEKELAGMDDAHEGMIWDMSWHPLGHMLVSGSNDHTTFVFILFLFTQ